MGTDPLGNTVNSIGLLADSLFAWQARMGTRYILERYTALHDVNQMPPALRTGFGHILLT